MKELSTNPMFKSVCCKEPLNLSTFVDRQNIFKYNNKIGKKKVIVNPLANSINRNLKESRWKRQYYILCEVDFCSYVIDYVIYMPF